MAEIRLFCVPLGYYAIFAFNLFYALTLFMLVLGISILPFTKEELSLLWMLALFDFLFMLASPTFAGIEANFGQGSKRPLAIIILLSFAVVFIMSGLNTKLFLIPLLLKAANLAKFWLLKKADLQEMKIFHEEVTVAIIFLGSIFLWGIVDPIKNGILPINQDSVTNFAVAYWFALNAAYIVWKALMERNRSQGANLDEMFDEKPKLGSS